MKVCTQCGETKPLSEFHKSGDPNRNDGYRYECKACRKENRIATYPENREKILAYNHYYQDKIQNDDELRQERNAKYLERYHRLQEEKPSWFVEMRQRYSRSEGKRANNLDYLRRRRDKNRGEFTYEEWQEILNKYDHQCLSCGSTERLEADHIVPLALGGRNEADNIQPLCRTCNASKHTKIIDYRPNYRSL